MHAEWYEVLWVITGVVWAGTTLIGTWTAWRDYRYARAHPDPDGSTQAQLIKIALVYLRYETSSLFGGVLVTAAGARAVLQPSHITELDSVSILLGLGFSAYAVTKSLISVQNRLSRVYFERMLSQKAGRADTTEEHR